MPAAVKSSNPFSDFLSKIQSFIQWFTDAANAITSQIEFVLNIKQIVTDDFQKLINDLEEITGSQADFADRIKHLRSEVVRADTVIQLWEDIRTGELRDFITKQLNDAKSSIGEVVTGVLDTSQQLGVFKSGAAGTTGIAGTVIAWIHKVGLVWGAIDKFIVTLQALVPIVQSIKDRLTEYESAILQQKNKRGTGKKKAHIRKGKLHSNG